MFNPIEINAAAREAAKLLGESGQVGRVEGKKYEVIVDSTKNYEVFNFGDDYDKVSDLAPTMDEFAGAVLTGPDGEGGTVSVGLNRDYIVALPNGLGGYRDLLYGFIVVTESFDVDGTVMPTGMYMLSDMLNDGEVMTVTWGNETIHRIDPKFIPGVCLPVVDLSITLEATTGATAELSAADIAKLDAAAEQNCPCVLQFVFGQMEVVATANRIGMGEALTSFYVDIGQAKAQFVKQGGAWMAMAVGVAE